MTTRHQLELGTVSIFALAACAGIFLAAYNNYKPHIQKSYALPIVERLTSPLPSVEPTPAVTTSSQPSPDGAKKLTLTVTSQENANKTYTLIASDSDDSNETPIYTITLPDQENISIPFNAWSPDDKYFFVIYHKGDLNEALVFRADGKPMSDTDQNFKVAATFKAKDIQNSYQVTTGWAAETLLIVNTNKPDGSKGPSYWFEVPSKAIIALSTEFYD